MTEEAVLADVQALHHPPGAGEEILCPLEYHAQPLQALEAERTNPAGGQNPLCGTHSQPWNPEQTEEEMAAYRDFGRVFSQIVNLDNDRSISETECRAFADVLELSGVTSR